MLKLSLIVDELKSKKIPSKIIIEHLPCDEFWAYRGEKNRCGLCPHKAKSDVGNLTMEK